MWFSWAASQGDQKGIKYRNRFAAKLTPQQLVIAQDLAVKIQHKIDNLKKESEISKADQLTPHRPKIKSSGTGFIITKDGYIVTCQHVVHGGSSIKIRLAGKDYQAEVVREDKYNDLALLKISGSFPALAFSSKRSAKMGQDVFTIGFPSPRLQGVNAKLTKGAVNSLSGFQDDLRMYQISVPVQPGNSGGPLLDLAGNVLGVIVAVLDAKAVFKITGNIPQNVNYSIKHTYAQAMIDTFPEVSNKLLPPHKKQPFNDIVNRVQKSVVLVLVYE